MAGRPFLLFSHSINNITNMFTGLVEIMGTVSSIVEQDSTESGGNGWTITVSDAAEILTDCHLGDSIAINGKRRRH
jgi:riboflavin synthase alpha subunit